MPETKYTTQIFLAVVDREAESAGKTAVRVYQDFLGRLRQTAPSVKHLRLDIQQPSAKKGADGVYECVSDLKAMVPSDLTALGADNSLDAWRTILRQEFGVVRHKNHESVHHASSRVDVTRQVLASEENPEAQAVSTEEKPRELMAVKVVLGGQEFAVQIPKGENLLDGVNDKGVAVKWDCKSGVCDTCKVKVLKGMENLSEPNDNEKNMLGDLVKQGYRLCCQVTANGPVEIVQ